MRGKSQVSSHSGRVRFLKVEEGIHILIRAVLLHDSVIMWLQLLQHAMEAAPSSHRCGNLTPNFSYAPHAFFGDSAPNEGHVSDQKPVVINATCTQ